MMKSPEYFFVPLTSNASFCSQSLMSVISIRSKVSSPSSNDECEKSVNKLQSKSGSYNRITLIFIEREKKGH